MKGDPRIQDQVSVALGELSNRYMDTLVQDLKQGTLERKILAAFGLGFSGKRSVLAPLVAAVKDGATDVRQNALGALGLLHDETTPLEPIRKALSDPETEVRVAALFALSRILPDGDDKKLLPELHSALADATPEVRNEALITLRRVHKQESADPIIIKGLKSDTAMIRANAAVALGMIAYHHARSDRKLMDRILEHLIETLRDSQHIVVQAVHQSLRFVTGKEYDRQYQTWREWYDEEKREEARTALLRRFICPDHPERSSTILEKCPVCSKEMVAWASLHAAPGYICTAHPQVVVAAPGKCSQCGQDLVLRTQEKK
jgi:hypothetical protein